MTNPTTFLWRMLVFLVAVAALVGLLSAEIATAFGANPLLNGVIGAVLLLGIAWNIRQVLALTREVEWIEGFRSAAPNARQGFTARPVQRRGIHSPKRCRCGRQHANPSLRSRCGVRAWRP